MSDEKIKHITNFLAALIFPIVVYIGLTTNSVLTPILIVALLALSAYLSDYP